MTIVNRPRKFIFLHARKTAGTSLEVHFVKNSKFGDDLYAGGGDFRHFGIRPMARERVNSVTRLGTHDSAVRLRAKLGSALWNDCFRVVGIRNPFENLLSYWRWQQSGRGGREDPLDMSFSEWAEISLSDDMERCEAARVRNARSLLYDFAFIENTPCVHHVIRFESINQSLVELAEALGQDIPPLAVHAKPSAKSDFREAFDAPLKHKAVAYYERYCDTFRYTF
jgi:hypothetical protein